MMLQRRINSNSVVCPVLGTCVVLSRFPVRPLSPVVPVRMTPELEDTQGHSLDLPLALELDTQRHADEPPPG